MRVLIYNLAYNWIGPLNYKYIATYIDLEVIVCKDGTWGHIHALFDFSSQNFYLTTNILIMLSLPIQQTREQEG